MGYLKCILLIFKALSSLGVNLAKSVITPIGEVPNVNASAHFFGCRVDYLFIYPTLTLVFLWALLTRAKQFETLLLRGSIRDWRGGKLSFCLEAED